MHKHVTYLPIHDLHDRSLKFYSNSKLVSVNIHSPIQHWVVIGAFIFTYAGVFQGEDSEQKQSRSS